MIPTKYNAIVIGVSMGGFDAISKILTPLPLTFPLPIIIVQHISPDIYDRFIIQYLNRKCRLKVKEAYDKESIKSGYVYFAPANYHLLIEKKLTFSLSDDKKVKYCRPSVDVLFETAAEAYNEFLIGIILTGANDDGADGIKKIKKRGGLTIVQNPKAATAPQMPQAAINSSKIDYILTLSEIAELLIKINVNTEC